MDASPETVAIPVHEVDDLPENVALSKGGGLWRLYGEGMKDLLFTQGGNESFSEFVSRCTDSLRVPDLYIHPGAEGHQLIIGPTRTGMAMPPAGEKRFFLKLVK
jgi:hypothetical protein